MYLGQVITTGIKPRRAEKLTGTMDKHEAKQKSSSLPGYTRGFHDMFRNYHNHNDIRQVTDQTDAVNHLTPLSSKNDMAQKNAAENNRSHENKKKKWGGWGGFFRRNKGAKKEASADSSSSGDEAHLPASQGKLGFLSRKKPKRDEKKPQVEIFTVNPSNSAASPPHPKHTVPDKKLPTNHTKLEPLSSPETRPNAQLYSPQNAGQPPALPVRPPWTLGIMPSDLSASQTSLSRRERRDAVLARAAARRDGSRNGSSSSDEGSTASARGNRYRSQESLASSTTRKSRNARTERYLQRRSRDEEGLRKDNQNQFSSYSQISGSFSESQELANGLHPPPRRPLPSPKWAATVVYQETSEFESPVVIRKSTPSPLNSLAGRKGNSFNSVGSNAASRTPPRAPFMNKRACSEDKVSLEQKISCPPPPPPPRNPMKKSFLLQVNDCTTNRPTSYSFGEVRHDYQNVDKNGHIILDRSPSMNSMPATVAVNPICQHLPFRPSPNSPGVRRTLSPPSPNLSQLSSNPIQSVSASGKVTGYQANLTRNVVPPFVRKGPEFSASPPMSFVQSHCDHASPSFLKKNIPEIRTNEHSPKTKEKLLSGSPHDSPSSRKSAAEFWRAKEIQKQCVPKISVNSHSKSFSQPNNGAHHLRAKLSPLSLIVSANTVGSVSSLSSDPSSPRSKGDPSSPHEYHMMLDNKISSKSSNPPPTPKRHFAHSSSQLLQHQQPQQTNTREGAHTKSNNEHNLEQAICELEAIYHSLRLSDEDLLDRAERRDLPTVHQEIHRGVSVCSSGSGSGDFINGGITSDLDTMLNWSISGSFESLVTQGQARVRTPVSRRSAIPDKVGDDMAIRRLIRKNHTEPDPQSILAKTGSYLLFSPTSIGMVDAIDDMGSSKPDLVQDDIVYRQMKQANSVKVIDPQPPFGIPLGPITPASPSDYLHTNTTNEHLRPLFHPTKYPDLVRDDLAFRNLRKDGGQIPALAASQVNTDKLDDLLKEAHQGENSTLSLRKKRAIRSLSANIAHLIRKEATRPNGGGDILASDVNDFDQDFNGTADSRAQSMTDITAALNCKPVAESKSAKTPRAVKQRSGLKKCAKNTSNMEENHQGNCEQEGTNEMERSSRLFRPLPSWLERANLSDFATSTETLTEGVPRQCTPERIPALAALYPKCALLAEKQISLTNSVSAAKEVATTLDSLIADLKETSAGVRDGKVDTRVNAQKPPSGLRDEVAAHRWEESPLFRSIRPSSPPNSSDTSEASCGAREIQRILQKEQPSAGRKKSATPDQSPKVAGSLSIDPGAPANREPSPFFRGPIMKTTSIGVSSKSSRRMSSNSDPVTAEKRAERIARYKEERRKQLQARHTTTTHSGLVGDGSSSNDEQIEQPSYMKYKQRKQGQKENLPIENDTIHSSAIPNRGNVGNVSETCITDEAGAQETSSRLDKNVQSLTSVKRFIRRESPLSEDSSTASGLVRSNRAARLRAAAASSTLQQDAKPDAPRMRPKRLSVTSQENAVNACDSPTVPKSETQGLVEAGLEVTSEVTLRQKSSTHKEKDKSTKRKSNLNRALTEEQVIQPSESNDDSNKRSRRRRFGEGGIGISNSSAETDPSSSLDGFNVKRMNDGNMAASQSSTIVNKMKANTSTNEMSSPTKEEITSRAVLRKTSTSASPVHYRQSKNDIESEHSDSKKPTPKSRLAETATANKSGADDSSTSPYPSVPWRTSGKVAVKTAVKAEDITSRIEALTVMARQTVARVDRLTSGSDSAKTENATAIPSPTPVIPSRISKTEQETTGTEAANSTPVIAGWRNRIGKVNQVGRKLSDSTTTPIHPDAIENSTAESKPHKNDATTGSKLMNSVSPTYTDSKSTSGVQAVAARLNRASGTEKTTNSLHKNSAVSNRQSRIEEMTAEHLNVIGAQSLQSLSSPSDNNETDSMNTDHGQSETLGEIGDEKNETISCKHEDIQEKLLTDTESSPAASLGSQAKESCASSKVIHSILKKKSEDNCNDVCPKSPDAPKHGVRIRTNSVSESGSENPQSILRCKTPLEDKSRAESPDPVSILKRKPSREELESQRSTPEPHSILKRQLSRDESTESRSLSPEPHSILKRKGMSLNEVDATDPRPILKKRVSSEENAEPRPILKKKSSTDDDHDSTDKPKPILKSGRRKSSEQQQEIPRDNESGGILKRRPESELGSVLRMRRALEGSNTGDSDSSGHIPSPVIPASEPRPLSVAERITSMETRTLQNETEFHRDVPWRHSDRSKPKVNAENNPGCNMEEACGITMGAIPKRRKSLDNLFHPNVRELNPVEAINAHVGFSDQNIENDSQESSSEPSNSQTRGNRRLRLSRATRSSTQPVTFGEVHEAAKLADSPKDENIQQPDVRSAGNELDDTDPCKLSLAERVHLFDRKKVEETKPEPYVPVRRRRALISRFQTQPITSHEVHQAQQINQLVGSLATSFVSNSIAKPVQTTADTLPVKAESTYSKSSTDDTGTDSGTDKIKGILRKKSSESITEVRGILRSKSPSRHGDSVPKSILKRQTDFGSRNTTPSSSSSEDLTVLPEQDLAAKLLNVELQAKEHSSIPETDNSIIMSTNAQVSRENVELERVTKDVNHEQFSTTHSSSLDTLKVNWEETESNPGGLKSTENHSKCSELLRTHPEKDTSMSDQLTTDTKDGAHVGLPDNSSGIKSSTWAASTSAVESEESGSGTETTTTVTLRLGSATTKKEAMALKSQTWTKKEMKSTLADDIAVGIASRLAALHKSGETDWRKRLSKIKTEEIDIEVSSVTLISSDNSVNGERPSIADRLKVLQSAQSEWKRRVHEPDAVRFTVAGKMGRQQTLEISPSESKSPTPLSPLIDRKKKTPKPVTFRSKITNQDGNTASVSLPGTPPVDDEQFRFTRSNSESNSGEEISQPKVSDNNSEDSSRGSKVISRVVPIPRPDDETFTSFFTPSVIRLSENTAISFDIKEEDFDQIIAQSRDLIVERRTVQIQKRRFMSRNPVKSLIQRTDLQDEYLEINTGVAERELRRLKLEQLSKNSHLAVEALAGLASKEDFTAITLKSSQNSTTSSSVYLLQIKGRRHVQTRLVEPVVSSVNGGDCYILVTPTDVIQWMGRYSNVIERAKCADVAQRILLKKDLGCAQASQVQIVDEDKVGVTNWGASKKFWKALGRTETTEHEKAGPAEEDELYEAAIVDTNMIWEVQDDELVPCEEYWGTLPCNQMLQPTKVFVFDFGSEMYVWSGKQAQFEKRKRAMQLAKELWEEGYDYNECEISPIYPQSNSKERPKMDKSRPSWALLERANQHMEPILFREKFLDWPDSSRLIKLKSQESDDKSNSESAKLEPYDAKLMIDNHLEEPDLELEGAHLGRGIEYYDEAERRLQQIATLSVKVWHINGYDKLQISDASWGQFHSRDTYIVRWQYRITVTGRDLKGQASKHGLLGRDRCCYFFWHGSEAPPTEQGASALTTVELDEERGPHVRVLQGHEPPAFLTLFQGRMVIHRGKREEESIDTSPEEPWRLFIVRGEKDTEAHLIEIQRAISSLRSRASFILINRCNGHIHVWHGAKSLKHTRHIAGTAAASLKQHRPPEIGFLLNASVIIKEQYEGAESQEFWDGVGKGSRNLYVSLLKSSTRFDYTPRLFHLTSLTGVFTAEEIAPPLRNLQVPFAYPFLQGDLYQARQPALFMFDNQEEIWLWQGWWPVCSADGDNDNANTGSGKLRWTTERRCALETVLHYCQLKNSSKPPPAYLVSAGLEPSEFTCLFPEWVTNDDIAQLNIQEGRKPGERLLVSEVLDRLKRTTYTLAELQERPLPEGVDPSRLESYLNDSDFQDVLKMTKEEFYALPPWKQTQLRKEADLF